MGGWEETTEGGAAKQLRFPKRGRVGRRGGNTTAQNF